MNITFINAKDAFEVETNKENLYSILNDILNDNLPTLT